MPGPAITIDESTLRMFKLGTLPAEAVDQVTQWLSQTPDAATVLDDLDARDSVTEAIGLDPPDTGVVGGITRSHHPHTWAASPDADVERLLADGYRVLGVLGRGGMGVVLEAEEIRLNRRVAIKLIASGFAANPEARERFRNEAQAVAKIDHPNVVPVLYCGGGDRPYLVMPVLKGETFNDRLKRDGKLPADEVMRIAREVAAGLAAAHAAGLIHRDVKPANLWLDADTGRVRLLDFGLVKPVIAGGTSAEMTAPGALLGTINYIAPEQAMGKPVDCRADLFSLGVVLFQAATGERPFTGDTPGDVLSAILSNTPTPDSRLKDVRPARLAAVIRDLLQKDPARRLASAAEVITRLRSSRPSWGPWLAIAAGFLAMAAAVVVLVVIVRDKDGKVVARVTVPEGGKAEVGADEPGHGKTDLPVTSDVNRRAAEWVLGIGGRVQLNAETRVYTETTELPKVAFRVTLIDLTGNKKIDQTQLAIVEGCQELRYVKATDSNISDAALAHLAKCAGLRAVDLNRTEVGDVGLKHLANNHKLSRVNLVGTKVTDEGMFALRKCTELQELYVSHTAVTDDGLRGIGGRTRLTHLYCQGTKVTGSGLKTLVSAAGLRFIDFANSPLENDGLLHLKGHTQFTHVELQGTKVTDAGLATFSGCKGITLLDLSDVKVTDAGLSNFTDCKSLEVLYLVGTGVTDAGLAAFQDCRQLQRLDVRKTGVTAAKVAEWHKALPGCRIDWDGGVFEPKK